MAGPRDWSPTETASYSPPRCPRPSGTIFYSDGYAPTRRRSLRSAWISLLLGLIALGIAFVQPDDGATIRGFLASTVGISAIAYGIHFLGHRPPGASASFIAAVLGMVTGLVGTIVMALYVVAFFQSPAQDAGFQADQPVAPPAVVAQAPAADGIPSAPGSFASPDEERMSLAQLIGTLDFALRESSPDGLYPESLAVTTGDGLVTSPAGTGLVVLPPGASFAYKVSTDRGNYSASVTGATFGTTASFDSQVGQVLSE